jgi:hypothetical protein
MYVLYTFINDKSFYTFKAHFCGKNGKSSIDVKLNAEKRLFTGKKDKREKKVKNKEC